MNSERKEPIPGVPESPSPESGRRPIAVAVVTVVIALPVGFFLISLGLVVAEVVIIPTAALALAVMTAVVASWAAGTRAGDGTHPDIGAVAGRNLAWALPLAAALVFFPFERRIWLLVTMALYTGVIAAVLAVRHRRNELGTRRRIVLSLAWLGGTVVAVAVVVVAASWFGAAGA